MIVGKEECDDANLINSKFVILNIKSQDDGCSEKCQIESGFKCNLFTRSISSKSVCCKPGFYWIGGGCMNLYFFWFMIHGFVVLVVLSISIPIYIDCQN